MANIYRQSQMFRAALIRRERKVATELAKAYTRMFASVQKELEQVVVRVAREGTSGLIIRERQLRMLLAQIERQATKFTAIAVNKIAAEQSKEIGQGAEDALSLLRQAYAGSPPGLTISFAQLPEGVIESMVGNLGNGSPLRNLLNTFGAEASRDINTLLINSIGAGRSLRTIARDMQRITQQPLARTLLVSRTEVLRAYRQGSIATYQANKDVVKGWTWVCAASARTCMACWMLHGTEHPASEEFSSHPNCRCCAMPLTKTWSELGIDGMREQPPIQSGESQFLMLPAKDQRAILGDASYRAWKAGAVDLQDFVGVKRSAEWGETHYHRSLREILGPDAAQYSKPAEPIRRAA
jgi:SPP1 gp7 family putative phage head morphogenesis protein